MCIAPSRFRWLHQGRVCLKEAKSGLVCVADRKAVSALLYRPPLVQLSGRQGYSRSPFMEELAGCIKFTKSCRGIATRLDMRSRIYAPSRGPSDRPRPTDPLARRCRWPHLGTEPHRHPRPHRVVPALCLHAERPFPAHHINIRLSRRRGARSDQSGHTPPSLLPSLSVMVA